MQRFLLLVTALAVVAVACGGGDDTTTDATTVATTAVTTTRASTTSRATTTTAMPDDVVWPLTGLPAEAADRSTAEVLIAKYSNAPKSRPQQGLEEADVAMEVVVEGGVVRIIAVFQSSIPDTIGPLRSAREVDPKLIEPFDGFFASSGGQPSVLADISDVAVNASDGRVAGFFRQPGRPAPYDLFLDTEAVFDMAELGTEPAWPIPFDDAAPTGEQALSVRIPISSFHTTNYRYSATDGGYLRFNGETAHETADGDQLVASSVVAIFVPQISTGRVDGAGAPVPDYTVTGTGEAVVFRDGVAVPGTWERGQTADFFRLFDESGAEIALKPGQTWFEIIPDTRTIEWE